jgi:protein regulator of cytokinesis 1
MEQLAKIQPVLEDLRRRRDDRLNDFRAIQLQIVRLQAEISGAIDHGDPAAPMVDENDLSLKRLGELKEQLNDLQTEKVAYRALKFSFPGCLAAILKLIVFFSGMQAAKN